MESITLADAQPTRRKPWFQPIPQVGGADRVLPDLAGRLPHAGAPGVPFVLAVWISMTDRVLGEPGKFVWLSNFTSSSRTRFSGNTVWNSFVYTFATVFLKMFLGVILALLLNQEIPCRNLIRGAILLPWIVPTSLQRPHLALDVRFPVQRGELHPARHRA